MKIMSIDPGYERLGIAIIEKGPPAGGKSKEKLIHSECFKTSPKDSHPTRLGQIHNHIEQLLQTYKPEKLIIETLFFQNNAKTAMQVAEARGTIISLCAARGVLIHEYTPLQIKAAVTGNGKSDKEQIIKMIPLLILIEKTIKHDDEYDAIACGLTYFACNPVR